MSEIFPALTEDEMMEQSTISNGIPLIEDEDYQFVVTYWHEDKGMFLQAVEDYDRSQGLPDGDVGVSSVEHTWAVVVDAARDHIVWSNDYEGNEESFPITVGTR